MIKISLKVWPFHGIWSVREILGEKEKGEFYLCQCVERDNLETVSLKEQKGYVVWNVSLKYQAIENVYLSI